MKGSIVRFVKEETIECTGGDFIIIGRFFGVHDDTLVFEDMVYNSNKRFFEIKANVGKILLTPVESNELTNRLDSLEVKSPQDKEIEGLKASEISLRIVDIGNVVLGEVRQATHNEWSQFTMVASMSRLLFEHFIKHIPQDREQMKRVIDDIHEELTRALEGAENSEEQ